MTTKTVFDCKNRDLIHLATGATLTAFVTAFIYKVWNLSVNVPIAYSSDALSLLSQIKNIRLSGSIYTSNLLGFPFTQNLQDVIAPGEFFDHSLIWILIKLNFSDAAVMNILFFATFLFVYAGGYVGARVLKLTPKTSIAIGILYTFLPYHFLRGPIHLYLSNYSVIPVICAIAIRQLSDEPIITDLSNFKPQNIWNSGGTNKSALYVLLACMASATAGMYYAAFGALLILFAGVFGSISSKNIHRLYLSLILLLVMSSTFIVQMIPKFLYEQTHGRNISAAARTLAEVEYYGLKITNLLIPVQDHRVAIFSHLHDLNENVLLRSENTSALGILGSISLFGLFIAVLVCSLRGQKTKAAPYAAIAGFAVLLGTVGGLVQFVAIFGATQLRAWNRISVVIAFGSFAAAGLWYESLKLSSKKMVRCYQLFAVICVALSLFDMTPSRGLVDYSHNSSEWTKDSLMVKRVENEYGRRAAIFMLPIMSFPENGNINQLNDYEHMKGYLHSDTLRWSYGGVKGRIADWQLKLPQVPDLNSIHCIRSLGFSALWVNILGISDKQNFISQLESLTGSSLESLSTDVKVFDLRSLVGSKSSCNDFIQQQ